MTTIRRLIQPAISFSDAAFDTKHCEKFCLVMEIQSEQLTLAVLDNLTNDFLAFEQYHFRKQNTEELMAEQIAKLAEEHEWLSAGFKRVDVLIVTEKFTLVPSALFDSHNSATYLYFNQPKAENEIVLNDLLRNGDARNVYAINDKLDRAVRKIHGTARIRQHLSPLIERQLFNGKNKTGKKAFVHIQQGRFDLIISEGNNLQMANSFRYQTSEDFIYFLLYSCEQLKMNPEQMEVEMAGEVQTDSAIAGLARKYIRNVNFVQRPTEARFGKNFDQFAPHFYHNLFILHYYA
jgi:hypothetical protein